MPKKKPSKLPKYVCRGTSAYLYVPYVPGEKRKSYRLCGLEASIHEVWEAHRELTSGEVVGTLEWLLHEYQASPAFTSHKGAPKSDKTIKEHTRQIELIINYPIGGGRLGGAALADIEPPVIRNFLDWRLANNGGIAGNHEVSIISKAWSWARERGKTKLVNPCIGVTRNPKTPRQHYADDTNYNAWLKYLDDKKAPAFLYIASELAYLCRMRKIEIMTAKKTQATPDGFDTLRRKGSRDAITSYSPRLKAVLKRCDDLAKNTERGRFSQYLVLTDKGKRITESGFNSCWQRHMRRAIELKYVQERFTTHDLKRKGATDSDQDATISTGNTEAMTRVYDVSKLEAKPTK